MRVRATSGERRGGSQSLAVDYSVSRKRTICIEMPELEEGLGEAR